MVDRDHELAIANELRMHLASHLGTDNFLPAADDATENERVLQATLTQQRVNGGTNGHCLTRPRLLFTERGHLVSVTYAIGLRPATNHCLSLPSTSRTTSFGDAPGGNSPAVVKKA
jgi:hypothetical protein